MVAAGGTPSDEESPEPDGDIDTVPDLIPSPKLFNMIPGANIDSPWHQTCAYVHADENSTDAHLWTRLSKTIQYLDSMRTIAKMSKYRRVFFMSPPWGVLKTADDVRLTHLEINAVAAKMYDVATPQSVCIVHLPLECVVSWFQSMEFAGWIPLRAQHTVMYRTKVNATYTNSYVPVRNSDTFYVWYKALTPPALSVDMQKNAYVRRGRNMFAAGIYQMKEQGNQKYHSYWSSALTSTSRRIPKEQVLLLKDVLSKTSNDEEVKKAQEDRDEILRSSSDSDELDSRPTKGHVPWFRMQQLPVSTVQLLLTIYARATFAGDPAIVIDPFCGTGSTGIAAKTLGCYFVGVDQDKASQNAWDILVEQTKDLVGYQVYDGFPAMSVSPAKKAPRASKRTREKNDDDSFEDNVPILSRKKRKKKKKKRTRDDEDSDNDPATT